MALFILLQHKQLRNNTYLGTKCVLQGAFNKFPDFFVQAFKIVVDS